jgi:hypothetical protein
VGLAELGFDQLEHASRPELTVFGRDAYWRFAKPGVRLLREGVHAIAICGRVRFGFVIAIIDRTSTLPQRQ